MEKAMTQQLENMCRMLTKTREEVKILMNLVSTLNMVLTGEDPSPGESKSNPTDLDAENFSAPRTLRLEAAMLGIFYKFPILRLSVGDRKENLNSITYVLIMSRTSSQSCTKQSTLEG